MFYTLFETALGTCGLGWSELGVNCLQLPGTDARDTERRVLRHTHAAMHTPPAAMVDVITALQAYMRGVTTDFAGVVVDPGRSDPFCRRVYLATRAIAWGETLTYGELAARLGMGGGGAREVGQALGRNAVPIIIPCHRILGSGGKLGGFSAPGGPDTKRRLLELEGVRAGTPEGQGALF